MKKNASNLTVVKVAPVVHKTNNPNGRPLGAPNKITKEVRDVFKLLILNDLSKFQKELNSLTGIRYVTCYIKMLRLVLPYTIDYRKLSNEQLQTVVEEMLD